MSLFNELKRRNVFRVGIAYGVTAWLLIQISDTVLPRIGLPESAVTLVIVLLLIGFVPALIFAWAFEMTPEGIKREKDVDRTRSITNQTGRKLDRMIIGIMAMVIAFLLVDRFLLQGSQEPARAADTEIAATGEAAPAEKAVMEASVAVLPFVNMSGDANNEYFSDGLTETLLHMLAQLPELHVAARTSSFAFKGQNKDIGEIAGTLNVANILEGSVQRAGDRVRITAQLIRADDGFHVWSQSYDRTLNDIFAIQDEIASDVAKALGASLLGTDNQPVHGVSTSNTVAYEHYLRGLEQQAIYSYTSLGEAEGHFKDALARDPGFIEAKLALARNYYMKLMTGLEEFGTAKQAIVPLLEQVRQEDPGNLTARAYQLALATHFWYTDLGPEERNQAFEEMRALLPRLAGDTWVRTAVAGNLRFGRDKPEEALEVIQAGLLSDPLSAALHYEAARVLRDLNRYDEAIVSLQRAMELEPDNPNPLTEMAQILADRGDLVGALKWYRKATEADPRDHELVAQLASWFYWLELPEEGDRWAARCYAMAAQTPACKRVGLTQAWAHGDYDRELQLAQAMLEEDIDVRQFGFAAALFTYVDEMAKRGRGREAYDFLVGHYPSLAEQDEPPIGLKQILLRRAGVQLMASFASPEETQAAMNRYIEHFKAINQRDFDDWGNLKWKALISGNIDEAARIAMESDLSRPLSDNMRWKQRYQGWLNQPLAQRPEMAARLGELQRELDSVREEVRKELMAPEWNE